MNLEGLDPERVYAAITEGVVKAFHCTLLNEGFITTAVRRGVEEAVWRMITNSTDMPCADFYESVKEGVSDAVLKGAKVE